MALFDRMKDSISVAGQGVSQKARTATESVRIGNMIKNNERMIEKLTYQVGVQCVERHGDEEDSEYAELFKEILRLREENRGYQTELQKLTAVNTCPHCGFGNNTAAKFCISCGAPLTAPAAGKTCKNCGAGNTEDAVFCTECGARFPAEEETLEPINEEIEEVKPANTCKNCGAELEEDALFCTVCGTKKE